MISGGSADSPRLLDAQHRSITLGMVAFITLVAFEGTAIITALPIVARDLDAVAQLAWIINVFVATALVGQVLAGGWGDRHGPRRPLLGGIAAFGVGGLIAGLAPTFPVLLVGRGLQGFGAGTMIVLAYVIIGRAFDPRLRPKAFGILSAAWVLPAIVGPVVAGYVADNYSWRWLFLAVIVLVWPPVLLVSRRLPEFDGPTPNAPVRPAGETARRGRLGVQAAIGLIAVQAGAQHGGWWGAGGVVVGLVLLIPALIALFPAGTLRLRLGLPAVVAVRGLLAAALFSAEAWVPLALQDVRGVSTTWSGIFLACGAIGWAIGAWFQGRAPAWFTPPRMVQIGSVFVLISLACLPLSMVMSISPAVLGPVWTLGAFGMGMAISALATLLLAYSDPGEQGINSAGLQVADSSGIVLATGLTGAVFAAAVAAGTAGASTFTIMWWMSAAIALGAVVVAPRVRRGTVA